MLAPPATKAKVKKPSRQSAPSTSLHSSLKQFQVQNGSQPTKNDEVLDLFGDFSTGNASANNTNNNKADAANPFGMFSTDDQKTHPKDESFEFDPFGPMPAEIATNAPGFDKRDTVNLEPDRFFDPAMWEDFGDNPVDLAPRASAPATTLSKQTAKFQGSLVPLTEAKGNEGNENDKGNENESVKKIPLKEQSKGQKETKLKKQESATTITTKNVSDLGNTNALMELHRGAALLKYPRRTGFPHFKHIQLSQDNSRIQWFSKKKSLDDTCVLVKEIKEVVKGQQTEVFKKFAQKTLEKSSFSVVYGFDYKTLDVAAKSIDECDMWVRCLNKLVELLKTSKDISTLKKIDVGIRFKDRNRPKSRIGSGNFIRAHNSKNMKVDPMAQKEIAKDMELLHKTYQKVVLLSSKNVITKSQEYDNIKYVLSELEERMEELNYEIANIRDSDLAKREVWRANVDVNAMLEKVEVMSKQKPNLQGGKRQSSFF